MMDAFKAVFRTTLVIDPALQVISNTRIVLEQPAAARFPWPSVPPVPPRCTRRSALTRLQNSC